MIYQATALATLARETAEDVFDGLTVDCSEPHRLERARNTMGVGTTTGGSLGPNPNKTPRYSVGLVPTPGAVPTPPPATAAPAAVLEAGADDAGCETPELVMLRRVVALEAECDRLAAEAAALRAALEFALVDIESYWSGPLDPLGPADRIRAALAAATAPQAAGTGTGGWTREAPYTEGKRWVVWRYQDLVNGGWHTEPAVVNLHWVGPYLRIMDHDGETILLYGPTYEPQEPPPGWREALAALDQDQEADHAAP